PTYMSPARSASRLAASGSVAGAGVDRGRDRVGGAPVSAAGRIGGVNAGWLTLSECATLTLFHPAYTPETANAHPFQLHASAGPAGDGLLCRQQRHAERGGRAGTGDARRTPGARVCIRDHWCR